MAAERYVVLGLAQARSGWFRDLARWSNAAVVPVEFIKRMSVEQVRMSLRSGRGLSALLIDDSMSGLDRDLVDLCLESGCAVVLVDSGRARRTWIDLGASAVLPLGFSRAELMQILGQVATPVARSSEAPAQAIVDLRADAAYRGRLIAVTGPGGTGRSTVAMAIAQGLASDARHAGLVCLADLSLHADLAMLHDAADVVPGVVELVEAHRSGTPSVETVRALTWRVDRRGYHLLLGLRRHRDWTAIRPRAFEAGLEGLRRGFRVVVADIDADLEGEALTGSLDVEERNTMARVVADAADLVVAVGEPGLHGVHSLLRVTRDLLHHGVSGGRILPVVNRSPRGPRARAELTRAFGELLEAAIPDHGVPTPVHVGERRNLETDLRDGARLHEGWLAPVCAPVQSLLDRHAGDLPSPDVVPQRTTEQLVPVAPGSLGTWPDDEDDEPNGSEGGR